MKRTISISSMLGLALFTGFSGPALCDGRDEQGNVGATSYKTLPFQNQVFGLSWGGGAGLTPMNLYFQANPKSIFYNPQTMATAQGIAAQITSQNIVPFTGAQRWEDTYAMSFPAGTFKNEPSWVTNDRAATNAPNQPEYVAWRNFITNHPQYWATSYTGAAMPGEPYYSSWGGQWGHINPHVPLDQVDCPPDKTSCTYGDLFAYQWGLGAAKSGVYGIALSDFVDSMPGRMLNMQDYNARIMDAFAVWENARVPNTFPNNQIPGTTTTDKASAILTTTYNHWADYLATGYARFYAALVYRLTNATGHQALIIDQAGDDPKYRRLTGVDQRIMAQYLGPKNYLNIWDDHVIQGDRAGPVNYPPIRELGGFIIGAAREPLMRNGANLEAEDDGYWGAISQFYPTLDAATQKQVGYGLMKRLWLYSAWAHIGDRSGNVRRALAFTSRSYWDGSSLAALDPLTQLIQTIYPTKVFGAAYYYSGKIERITEAVVGGQAGPGNLPYNTYSSADDIGNTLDSRIGVNYFVSDAGLPSITAGSAAAPSAWIVIDRANYLTSSERTALSAIAPIVSSGSAATLLPNQPLTFTRGLAGFGFYDQNNRLTLVVSNPSTQPTAVDVRGYINLAGLADGTYTATELFTNVTSTFQVTSGVGKIPVSVKRWDTQAFAITPQ
ncbi:hypothetical protein [Beijerinckia indica]|uniref:Uncharacterized protein n=1 Tax=Beijerinckia indica subsp. indica (strain ATCC 9039 / DSM 1715 / NCIMB 8712) TaxID=395963 RepID=B2IIQ8_BEII9|nr:hypothetical protein [Beijerinckia indica]ACB94751.1 hypothetical protein Bind_1109 [Beijerinckia indica subsp. indica ATCC 9039]